MKPRVTTSPGRKLRPSKLLDSEKYRKSPILQEEKDLALSLHLENKNRRCGFRLDSLHLTGDCRCGVTLQSIYLINYKIKRCTLCILEGPLDRIVVAEGK